MDHDAAPRRARGLTGSVLMRLRITRQLSGVLDGVDLSRYRQGFVYDVGTTFAGYLLAMDAAVPLFDEPSRAADSATNRPARKPGEEPTT